MQPFPYFRNPKVLSAWSDEPAKCDFCGTEGPGFDGPYYGETDVDRVCETCLRAGRLAELEVVSNEVDLDALRLQIADRQPDLDEAAVDALVIERSDAVDTATPHLITWQDFFWPSHCGDCCEFVEELGKPDILALASDEDPAAWLAARALDAGFPIPWDSVRQSSAREFPDEAYDLTVYRFDCRECGAIRVHWDMS